MAPAPPTLFPDKFLFMNHPKKKISEAMADDVFVDEPILGLWRRLGARVIRLSYDYFQRVKLDTCGATAHTSRPHNHSSLSSSSDSTQAIGTTSAATRTGLRHRRLEWASPAAPKVPAK